LYAGHPFHLLLQWRRQEQLLASEEVLSQRDEALTVQEEKARISKMPLVKVNIDIDVECAKTEGTHKEYLDKMQVSTARAMHTLGLDKMMGEKKVKLNGKVQDLDVREAVLAEAQSRDLNSWDNCEEMMELVELQMRHEEVRLYIGMPPIPGIPQAQCTSGDVM
jgi:uncharacterized 2Fe-2S/4Fe-4S cluster protein (DUF4445 family)